MERGQRSASARIEDRGSRANCGGAATRFRDERIEPNEIAPIPRARRRRGRAVRTGTRRRGGRRGRRGKMPPRAREGTRTHLLLHPRDAIVHDGAVAALDVEEGVVQPVRRAAAVHHRLHHPGDEAGGGQLGVAQVLHRRATRDLPLRRRANYSREPKNRRRRGSRPYTASLNSGKSTV